NCRLAALPRRIALRVRAFGFGPNLRHPPPMLLGRRALLAGGALLGARLAEARGRLPVAGRLTFHLPWPLGAIDPHRLDDAACAVLGEALFDTLYARDASGAFVPVLAEGEPELDGAAVRISVRGGLKSARGQALDARAVVSSIARARSLGAHAWLAEVPAPRV